MDLTTLLESNEGTVITEHAGMGRVVVSTRSIDAVGTKVIREHPAIVWRANDWSELLQNFQECQPSVQEAILDMFHPPLESEAMQSFKAPAKRLVHFGIVTDVDLIHKLLAIVETNAHEYYGEAAGAYYETFGFPGVTRGTNLCALFVYGSKVAHSCLPNTSYSSKTHDGCLEYKLIRPINEGDIVTFSYLDELFLTPTHLRREKLLRSKSFVCKCERCVGPDYCRFLHCPTTSCSEYVTSTDPGETSSSTTWTCPKCGVIDQDAALSLTRKESAIKWELDALKLQAQLQLSPTSLPSTKALVTKAVAQLSRVHFLTLRAMEHYITVAASLAVQAGQMAMMGLPIRTGEEGLRLKAAEAGFDLVSACECVAAGCCRKHCKVANVETHEALHECYAYIFQACQDLFHVPSREWPAFAIPMVQRYLPHMRICFGQDDVDVRKIEEVITSKAEPTNSSAVQEEPSGSPLPKQSSTARAVTGGGKKNRKKKRGKKKRGKKK